MTGQVSGGGLSWGFSTLGCTELSLPEICKLLYKFDLHELELRGVHGRMDMPEWAAETGWTPLRATALLAKHQIGFRVAGSSFKLVGNDAKSRAELLTF